MSQCRCVGTRHYYPCEIDNAVGGGAVLGAGAGPGGGGASCSTGSSVASVGGSGGPTPEQISIRQARELLAGAVRAAQGQGHLSLGWFAAYRDWLDRNAGAPGARPSISLPGFAEEEK